jgi:hypothetical protein
MGQFGHVFPKHMLVPAATPNADGSPAYTQVVPVPDEIRVWDRAHPRFGDAVDSAFISRRRCDNFTYSIVDHIASNALLYIQYKVSLCCTTA